MFDDVYEKDENEDNNHLSGRFGSGNTSKMNSKQKKQLDLSL